MKSVAGHLKRMRLKRCFVSLWNVHLFWRLLCISELGKHTASEARARRLSLHNNRITLHCLTSSMTNNFTYFQTVPLKSFLSFNPRWLPNLCFSNDISRIVFLRFCRTWTKRYSCRVCEVIGYRLVQVRQNLENRKTFRVGSLQSPFSISSLFHSLLRLTSFLSQNKNQQDHQHFVLFLHGISVSFNHFVTIAP